MTTLITNNEQNRKRKYDLEERTAQFGEAIIELCQSIRETVVTKPILNQLVRSGTSIGLNYAEAVNASSKRDFRNKICIIKKESQESKLSLRFLAKAVPSKKEQIRSHWKECHELTLIFQKTLSSLDAKNPKKKKVNY